MSAFFNVAFLLYFIPLLVITCFTRQRHGGTPTNFCGRCGYSKEGLSAGTPCPECGCTELKHIQRHTTIVIRRNANWKLVATTLALVLLISLFGEWLMTQLIIQSYVRDGFRADSAAIAIRYRELADRDYPISLSSARGASVPIGFVLAFSPLLATLRNRKLAWWIFGGSISVTLLFSTLYLLSI